MINIVKDLRIAKGYTQEYMAHKCKISLSNYIRIENNKVIPNVETAIKIKNILEEKYIEDVFIIEKD